MFVLKEKTSAPGLKDRSEEDVYWFIDNEIKQWEHLWQKNAARREALQNLRRMLHHKFHQEGTKQRDSMIAIVGEYAKKCGSFNQEAETRLIPYKGTETRLIPCQEIDSHEFDMLDLSEAEFAILVDDLTSTQPPYDIQEWQATTGDRHCSRDGRNKATNILRNRVLPLFKASLSHYPNTASGRKQCREFVVTRFYEMLAESFPTHPWEISGHPVILVYCSDDVMFPVENKEKVPRTEYNSRVQLGQENTYKFTGDKTPKYGPASDVGIAHFLKTRIESDANTLKLYQDKADSIPFSCPELDHFRMELGECKRMVFQQEETIESPAFHKASVRNKMTHLKNLWTLQFSQDGDRTQSLEQIWKATNGNNKRHRTASGLQSASDPASCAKSNSATVTDKTPGRRMRRVGRALSRLSLKKGKS